MHHTVQFSFVHRSESLSLNQSHVQTLTIFPKDNVQKCSFRNSNIPSMVNVSRKHRSSCPTMWDGVVQKYDMLFVKNRAYYNQSIIRCSLKNKAGSTQHSGIKGLVILSHQTHLHNECVPHKDVGGIKVRETSRDIYTLT